MSKPIPASQTDSDSPLAQASPPGHAPSPPLGRVLFLCVVWWGVIVAHFLACSRAAYAIGHPDLIPSWLVGVDELFQHGISTAVDLILLLLWWVIVFLLFIPGWFVADFVNRRTMFGPPDEKPANPKHSTPREAALVEGLFALAPVLAMTILSLLILPAQAPNHYEFDSGAEMAEQLGPVAFVEYQYLSIVGMLVIFALAAGFCVGVGLVMKFHPNGGIPTFLLVILFAIGVAMATGLGLGPVLGALPERIGAYRATILLLGGIGLALSPPTLLILRQIDKKKSV
jgi:hypothetical protein